MQNLINEAAEKIKKSQFLIAFTGAGISVESGIPSFRGKDGLWNRYDPSCLDISYFFSHAPQAWKVIKEIFYDYFGQAKPNPAHIALAELEKKGILKYVITQNIDNLHFEAGNKQVIEFHGNTRQLVCMGCGKIYTREIVYQQAIPLCDTCHSLLKPDFVFFGEMIPEPAGSDSFQLAVKADVVLVIGTTGEVMPACNIPYYAKQNGATIIEINTEPSRFSNSITDIFLQGKASEIMSKIMLSV
ncbi:MAG: NAD-dependent deacylase [Sphingobacteriales bacterium]|nr:NAD-dependent deacylase [Sphingobacteriales bacterium]